jgi:glyoxalase family protein
MSTQSVKGVHHITAIAADPQRNLDFYTEVMGMRLVKLTVNFDDPGTYHFYFGNETGTPGSILTFFPWPGAERRDSAGSAPEPCITSPSAPRPTSSRSSGAVICWVLATT